MAIEDGVEREYPLCGKCQVVKITGKNYKDEQFETDQVIIVLEDNTQRSLFLSAWLPPEDCDRDETEQEMLVNLGWPYRMNQVRMALNYPNRLHPSEFYLRVMDDAARTNLKNHLKSKPSQRVDLIVLPMSEELKLVGVSEWD